MWQRCSEVLIHKGPVGCSPAQGSSTGHEIPVPKAELSTQTPQGKGPQAGQDHTQTMLLLHPPAQKKPTVPPRKNIIYCHSQMSSASKTCGLSSIVRSYASQFPFFEAEKYVSYILKETSKFLQKQFWIKPLSSHQRGKTTFKSMIVAKFKERLQNSTLGEMKDKANNLIRYFNVTSIHFSEKRNLCLKTWKNTLIAHFMCFITGYFLYSSSLWKYFELMF